MIDKGVVRCETRLGAVRDGATLMTVCSFPRWDPAAVQARMGDRLTAAAPR
jgi:hypothetical protein